MFTGKIGFPLKVESKLNRLFLMDFKSTQSKDLDSFWLTRCYLHSKAWELLLSHSRCDKTAIHTDETMWKVSQVLQMTNLLMMSVWVYPAKKEEEKQTNKQYVICTHLSLCSWYTRRDFSSRYFSTYALEININAAALSHKSNLRTSCCNYDQKWTMFQYHMATECAFSCHTHHKQGVLTD